MKIRVGSDVDFKLLELQNTLTGALISNATVTWKLYDDRGDEVLDGSDVVISGSMTPVTGEDGAYEGTIEKEDTALLVPRRRYSVVATVEVLSKQQDFALECVAVARHKET